MKVVREVTPSRGTTEAVIDVSIILKHINIFMVQLRGSLLLLGISFVFLGASPDAPITHQPFCTSCPSIYTLK